MSIYEIHKFSDPQLPFILHIGSKIRNQPQNIPLNWHENVEIFSILEGSGVLAYDDQRIPIRAGDIAVINSNHLHGVGSNGDLVTHCLIIDRQFCLSNFIDTNEILIPRLDEKGIWDCELSITREQVEWFIDSLCAIPSDHAAVVIGHIPFFKELRWNHYKARIFGELIEAYNARRTYSRMSWDGEDAFEVFADFSNASGRVVLTASGHGHYDDLYVSPDGCVNLEIHCDSYANNNGGSPTARIAGSVSEAVVDVVILDRDTGIVHTVRYGAGFDREVLR